MGKYERYIENCRGANFKYFYEMYKSMICQLFRWENLPNGLTSERLEEMLFDKGKILCLKYKTKVDGIDSDIDSPVIFLPITGEYNLNIYNQPQFFSAGYKNVNVNSIPREQCVVIKNNWCMQPTRPLVEYYVEKMLNIDSAKDLNINASKTPFVMFVKDEKEKLTINNFFHDIATSKPLIVVDDSLRSQLDNDKKLMTTGVVLNTDIYQQAYVDFKNELLTWLGINNTQMEKRERLLTDEINANNELIMDSVYSQLQLRTEASKKINEMFGTNISVSFLNFKIQEEKEKKQEKQDENENVSRETMEGENE